MAVPATLGHASWLSPKLFPACRHGCPGGRYPRVPLWLSRRLLSAAAMGVLVATMMGTASTPSERNSASTGHRFTGSMGRRAEGVAQYRVGADG